MWKDLEKRSIALGDVASWNVLMFLKIVTKWPEIQKSKLNNSLFTFYSITYFTIFTCFAISWNFNFAVNLVTSFSCQEPSKLKKKIGFFGNIKFYHPAKFELKRIKNAKSFPGWSFCVLWAHRESGN